MSEPLQLTIRLDYFTAVREQLRQAMEPKITWKGDPKQAAEDGRIQTMKHIAKAFNMITDITTVGMEKSYEIHLPLIEATKHER